MRINLHRRDQWDIGNWREACPCKPILACHVKRGDVTRRVFVLWRHGFRGFGIHFEWRRIGSSNRRATE
jgi:hypothetical protein